MENKLQLALATARAGINSLPLNDPRTATENELFAYYVGQVELINELLKK